jgi:plastocyanin
VSELSTRRRALLYAGMSKPVIVTGLLLSAWVGPAWATWSPGDRVVDYGVSLSDGEREVIVDAEAMGNKFDADLLWQVDPHTCHVQALIATERNGGAEWVDLQDDVAFDGHPAHAGITMAEGVAVTAHTGRQCDIGSKVGEFLTISTTPSPNVRADSGIAPPRTGATVLLLRATAFYMPREVRIRVGEKVVWFYADGSRAPHTVTSGACRGADCSGGGQAFASGPTLLKPGDRFEYTFTRPGTYPYHCEFHTATMQATVIVNP